MTTFNKLESDVLRFLKKEYLVKGNGPTGLNDPENTTFHRDIMAEFGLDLPGYREVMGRIESFGIVSAPTKEAHNGVVRIDDSIVDGVRQLDDPQPAHATTVNVVNVEQMSQSQIQQGTVGSSQIGEFSTNAREAVTDFVKQMREKLPELGLMGADAQVAEEDITTIERQLQSPRPKPGIVKECLMSLKSVAEGAAGSVTGGVAAQWIIQTVPPLLDMLS